MALWVVLTLTVCIIVTIIMATVFIHYYNLAYECDSQASFFCYVDWKCDAGTVNGLGNIVPMEDMECHLKGLYSVKDDSCTGQFVRDNPCTPDEVNSGYNPELCDGSNLITSAVDDNPFSCFCSMGDNIVTTYDGSDPKKTTGGQYKVGTYACQDFNQIIEGICSTENTSTDSPNGTNG